MLARYFTSAALSKYFDRKITELVRWKRAINLQNIGLGNNSPRATKLFKSIGKELIYALNARSRRRTYQLHFKIN